MVYWLAFIFVEYLLLAFYSTKDFPVRKSWILFMIIVVAVYFAGFRDGLGMDYEGYRGLCERDRVLRSKFWFFNEPLFELVRRFCYKTSFSAVIFFLVSAALTSIPAFVVYSKSSNLLLSGFIYLTYTGLYLFSFNVVRQFASAGLMLWAFYYFIEERSKQTMLLKRHIRRFSKNRAEIVKDKALLIKYKWLYFKHNVSIAKPIVLSGLLFLAAFAYHKSALIFLPCLFLRKDSYNEYIIVFLILFSYIFPISSVVGSMGIDNLLEMMDYETYLNYDNVSVSRFSLSNLYLHALLVPFLLCKKRVLSLKNHKIVVFAIKMFVLYLVCNNLSANGLPIAYRIGVVFSLFVPIALSVLPKLFDDPLVGYALIVIPMLFLFLFIGLSNEMVVPDRMLPLNSIWDSVYVRY